MSTIVKGGRSERRCKISPASRTNLGCHKWSAGPNWDAHFLAFMRSLAHQLVEGGEGVEQLWRRGRGLGMLQWRGMISFSFPLLSTLWKWLYFAQTPPQYTKLHLRDYILYGGIWGRLKEEFMKCEQELLRHMQQNIDRKQRCKKIRLHEQSYLLALSPKHYRLQ